MNKKIKNFILYGIFLLIGLGCILTPWFGKDFLWIPENNKVVPFGGIYFDMPTNINNLKIRRSENVGSGFDLISYDVEFEYIGNDSSMRVIGKLGEHAFFGDSVVPRHSKATLKGEYETINNVLFDERLNYGELYKKLDDYKFVSTSEIRVPLSESIKDYKFRISYEPKKLIYSENKKLAKLTVFLTNTRVENFTDSEYINQSEVQSFNESGMYVNVLELYDEKTINSMDFWNNVNNVIFILSIIVVLALIWLEKTYNPYIIILLLMINSLTGYRFFEVGIATRGVIFIFPILGIIATITGRMMARDRIAFNKFDFSQSLGGAILLLIIGVFLYVVPKTF